MAIPKQAPSRAKQRAAEVGKNEKAISHAHPSMYQQQAFALKHDAKCCRLSSSLCWMPHLLHACNMLSMCNSFMFAAVHPPIVCCVATAKLKDIPKPFKLLMHSSFLLRGSNKLLSAARVNLASATAVVSQGKRCMDVSKQFYLSEHKQAKRRAYKWIIQYMTAKMKKVII